MTSDDEPVTEVVNVPKEKGTRRVRRWGAADIAKYYETKGAAAMARGWQANLYIDGELATLEELQVTPPGADVSVTLGPEGSSATVTQLFELVPPTVGGAEAQVVGMAGELRQVITPLVGVIERLTAQYMKLLDGSGAMAKMVRKSLKKELKSHKGMRAAEKATADAVADSDMGVSAIVKTLGAQLGKEGLERVIAGGTAELFQFLDSKRKPPEAPPAPKGKKRVRK